MPLPLENASWPPAPWDIAGRVWEENNAWYAGDTATLQRIYQNQPGTTGRIPTHFHQGVPHAGGLAGAARGTLNRTFWGKPTPSTETRRRLHIPAASDLATLSSDLLFAEPPTVKLETQNENAQKRLDLIANSDEAHETFNQAGELAAALSASVFTTSWDVDAEDHVFLREHGADVSIPEFYNGHLVALTLFSEFPEGGTGVVYRHLERHESGSIVHALYKGRADHLGLTVPLEQRPETVLLATIPNAIREGKTVRIPTGITRLTASWMPNLPAREWRKIAGLRDAGRSDFGGGTKGLFDALDETWTSWLRDVDLGKARLVVPNSYLESLGFGGGAWFDRDREVYSGIETGAGQDGLHMEQVQFSIRHEEHEATARALYRRILGSAGYLDLDDDDDRGSPQTATQVFDETRAKERSRDKKALGAKRAIAQQSSVALELDAIIYPGKGGGRMDRPVVEFPEVSQEDPEKRSRVLASLSAAGFISILNGVAAAQPDLNPDDAAAEARRIYAEKGMSVPDPALLGAGGNPEDAALRRAADLLVEGRPSTTLSTDAPEDAAAMKARVDALGGLVRAGVDQGQAAERVGLPGLSFPNLPVTIRVPEADAAGLEGGAPTPPTAPTGE